MCVQVPLDARDISFALELKLQIAERCQTWVWGTQPRSSGRAGNTFNYGPISLAIPPSKVITLKSVVKKYIRVIFIYLIYLFTF